MKKVLTIALAATVVGCKTLPNDSTNTLASPHGDGALAIATVISKYDSTYPCETFTFDMQRENEGEVGKVEPETLRFFVYEDKEYALFDGIKPGNYILSQFRCNIEHGYVVDGKSYLSLDTETNVTIEANAVTVSPELIYATQDEDRSFSIRIQALPGYVKVIEPSLSEAIDDNWKLIFPDS
ncbi:hypothetical protein BCU97_08105 [Vibrio splendidus]|uniref:hypothetical protein n=1 Tax=Vibrio splendidus TaxID=29497 RepID=UPI000C816558|nr:hypothetical protein [Vibrio splendidus]PMG38762.1 hypothetical protein BCU97_08105 [Vibrio splendidus]